MQARRRRLKQSEAEVLRIRAESNNAWGGRKIARVLNRTSGNKVGSEHDHRDFAPQWQAR